MAMMLIFLLPATYYLVISPILYGDVQINYSLRNCECQICKERMVKRAKVYQFTYIKTGFFVKLAFLAVCWYAAYQCFEVVSNLEPLKNFVPHELLGVDVEATPAQIKKAYRRLSREKHPDKNPDNPEAVTEFIQITKAYTIMTDPKARENFLKFGNPDGRGSMAVSIALPNFLQQKEYQLQVLIIFFILIIFVVPYWFLSQIQANQKDIGGIEIENRRLFTPLINENMIGKNIPVILAHSAELSKMRVPKEEFAVLDRLKRLDDIKEVIPKTKQGEPPKVNAKPVILLMAYMHSHLTDKDYEIEGISEAMEQIIRNVPNYMEVMLGETMKLAHMFKMGQSPKRITAKNIMTLIQFSQNFMQGGWIHKDPFQQLPGFDQVSAGKMKNRLNKNLY
jgi:translocation protein SEC63